MSNKFVLKLFLILYVIFFSLRSSNVGFDYQNYIDVFNLGKNLDLVSYLDKVGYMEKGYLIINKFFTCISGSLFIFEAILAIIFVYCVYKFITSYTQSSTAVLLVFYCLGCMFNVMNITRSGLASALCLLAFVMFSKEEWIKGLVTVAFAFTIHTSALFGLYIFMLFKFKPTISIKYLLKNIFVIFISSIMFDELLNYVLMIFPRYQGYFSSDKVSTFVKNGSMSYVIVFLAILLLALICRNNIIKYKEFSLEIYDILISIALFGFAISLLSLQLSLVNRFMFTPLYISSLLIVVAIKSIPNAVHRLLFIISVSVFIAVYSYTYLYIAENGFGRDGVVPYELSEII